MSKINHILIAGNLSKGSLEHFYISGLKALGQSVSAFDIQTPVNIERNRHFFNRFYFRVNEAAFYVKINTELIQFAKKLKPTVIIIFKGMELYPSTIQELKSYTKLLCNYNPDHPFEFYSRGAGNQNVKDSIRHYDLYFSYAPTIATKLSQIYQVNTAVIPFGFDDNLLRKPSKVSKNYAFVGAFDHIRLLQLRQLQYLPIDVYGSGNWAKHLKINETAAMKVFDKEIYLEDYASVCTNSIGIINFLRKQNLNEQSHNMRTFEVPGYGGLLISERTQQQLFFFEEDKEAIYFSSNEELNDKLNFIEKNTEVAYKIKTAAYERVMKSNYSYTSRAKEMFTFTKKYV